MTGTRASPLKTFLAVGFPFPVKQHQQREQKSLALRELEACASTLLSVLLALFTACVAFQEASRLQLLAQIAIELEQCAGYAQAHCAGLSVDAAAGGGDQNVKVRGRIR